MNKIYRVIWSETLGTWVTVSEHAKSKNKSATKLIGAAVILSIVSSIPAAAFAGFEAGGGSTFTNCVTGPSNKIGLTAGSGIQSNQSIALGSTNGATAPIIGEACAPTTWSIAIGNGASTQAATPIGDTSGSSLTRYNQSIAIGQYAAASGDQAISLGANTVASGHSSISIGGDDINRAIIQNGADYTALTGDILRRGDFTPTTSSGAASVAIGMQNVASGAFSTAMGTRSQSSGVASIALGTKAQATNTGALAIGAVSQATQLGSVALGHNSASTGEDAVAIGSVSTASRDHSVAIGKESAVSTFAGVAIGAGSQVNADNSIAIGQNSVAEAQSGDSFLTNVAASSTNGTLSVGNAGTERRIQNVADGALDTDAVNVAQLRALKGITDELGTSTSNGLGGGSAYDPATGTVSAPNYAVNGTPVNNVGDAITALDKGWTLQSNGANAGAVKAGDTVDIGTADGESNLAVAKEGNNVKYSLNKDLTLTSVTTGNSVLNNNGLTIANGPSVTSNGIDAGNKVIKNVAAGVKGTDAANVDQLKAASAASKTKVQQGDNIVVTKTTNADGSDNYEVATAKDVKFDKTTVGNVVTDATTNKITGVEAGTVAADSKDVINGSQLHNTAESIATNLGGGSVVNPDGTVSAPNYAVNGTPVNNVGDAITALDKGWTLQSNGANAGAVKAGDTVDIGTADGESNLAVAKEGNNVKYSLNKDLTLTSVTTGNSVLNNNGLTIANGPSVTSNGIDAGNKVIKNVAAGVKGTDAANVDQLKAASAASKTKVQQGDNIVVTKTTNADGSDNYEVATAKDVKFDKTTVGNVVTDATTNKITGVEAGTVAADSKDVINGSQLHNTAESIATNLGGGSVVNPDGTVSAPNYAVNGTPVNNVGDAITALDKGWTLQSNGANAGAVKAGDTVDIGTADGESNLAVAKEGNNVKYSLNKDLTLTSVTTGNSVLNNNGLTIANGPSVTSNGIDAGNKVIKNVAAGVKGTDAANVDQLKAASAASKTKVQQGDNIVVTKTTNADGSDNYEVATAKDVKFDKTTVGNVVTDATTNKITGVEAGTVAADSKDVINGSQLHNTAESIATNLGGGSVVNPDGTVSAPNYAVNGTPVNNVGDAITALDKGWTLQSNGANAGAVKAGDTVDIGTADGESNLAVAKEGNNVKYSLNKDLTLTSVTTGNSVLNNNGLTIANGPSVTSNGIDAGNKVIKNVAAGVKGTDAANVDQLKAASAASKTKVQQGDNIVVTKTTNADGSDNYEVATAKDVKFDKTTVGNVVTDATTNKITGVEAGTVAADSKDVINGSQLHNTAESIATNLGGGSVVNPDGTVSAPNYAVNGTPVNNVGDAITALDKGWTLQSNGANAGAVKAGDTVDIGTADGESNLAVAKEGNNVKYSLNKDLTLTSVTTGNSVLNNNGLTIANGPSVTSNGIDAGNKVIKNVAAGVKGTDAANVDQLKAASAASKTKVQQGDNIVVTKTTNADGSDNYEVATAKDVKFDKITVGNVVTDATTNKITGVEAGTVAADSKDVINGSQLHAQGVGVKNIIGGTTVYDPVTGTYTNTNIGGTGKNNINDAIGAVNRAATQAKSTVTQGNNIVVKQTKNADGSNNYQVETAKDVSFEKVSVGNVVIDSKTNKITGVEAGKVAADSKDVVNGGQLYAQGVGVKDIIGGNTTYDPNTGKYINSDIGGTGKNNINDAIGAVRSAATQAKTTVTQGNNIVVKQTKNADGSNNYQVETAKEVNFDKVSVGNVVVDSNTNKITGVEAGKVAANSKDVVNGSQLHASNKKFADALGGGSRVDDLGDITAPNYTIGGNSYNNVGDALGALQEASTNNYNALNNKIDQGFYETNKRIDDVQKRANAGIASVLALENAPFVAGKYTYGVGTGFYGGEQAIGATLRKTADNGRWSLSGGVAGGTTGGTSIRVGISGVID